MKSPNSQLYALGIKTLCKHILLSLIVIASIASFGQGGPQLAFPSATGAAAYVTGGRGGTVYHVTNLNNSGSGSFRDAVSGSNRIIVFDVSGTIELTSNLNISSDNLTIAGQTAPQGGISITGQAVYFQNSDNVILRYVRFRPNYNSSGNVDALNAYNCTNFMVDHCSISWGGDEAFSLIGNSSNVTVQNCVLGESATGMIAGDSNNPTSDNFSIISNVFYNISHRFPNVNALRTDVINNVVHNWFTRLKVVSTHDNTQLNEINNFYQAGNKTGEPRSPDWSVNWLDIGSSSQRDNIRIYTDGNVYPSFLTEAEDDWSLYVHRFNVNGGQYAGTSQWDDANTDFQLASQLSLLGEIPTIISAEEALATVPTNAGANKYADANGNFVQEWDAIDNTYLTNVINGTSEFYSYPPTNIISKPSYVSFHSSVSNTPINIHSASYDTDNDGMADQWEIDNYGNLNNNGLSDSDNNGYDDIEDFINEVDTADTTGSQVAISSNVNSDTICEGEVVILTASGADSYVWSTGETTASITVAPTVTDTYTVTGTHSDSSTSQDTITITVNAIPNANAGSDVETCQGTAVTLTASGGTSYQWNTGATSQSIVVNPNTTTTYSVQVTQNGCTSSDSVIVSVTTQPNVDAGVDQTIFTGESATLIATGADTYLWSTGETTQSITVNPTLDTSYSVTGFIGNCESTDTVTVFLLDDSVNANAGADTTICIGNSTTLTATGGSTYLWNTGETTASIDVAPTSTTTYSVTAFSPSGNNTDVDTVTVTVNDLPSTNAGVDVSITEGESTTLTATGADTYLWNTGETTASIIVSPNTTTVYNVTGFTNGCESSDEVTVTVNIDSVTADAGEDTTICFGDSAVLTATGGASYLWNTGETSSSITVSPSNTTTYTVTVFNTNQTSSDNDSVIVTVNDLPAVNAGNDVTIVENESTTLVASGADTYVWSTGETTASITVSPNGTTTYTVTGFINGCEATDQVTVTVNTETVTANAGDDITICFGESTTLTATGGTSYQWSTGETTSSITVTPSNTTTYTVTAFNTNQTASDTASVMVTVNDLPNTFAGNDVTIIEGETTTLSASGATSYLWSTGATTASIEVSPGSTTTYTVTGFENGCEFTDEVTVIVEPFVFTASAGGDQVICQGYDTTLTASEGDSYFWSTGETTQTITVNPSNTQTYTVTVFLNGFQDDADVTVSVNPNPNVVIANGDEVMILEGEFITLSASGANSYLWNNGATQPNIAVSPSVTTTYEVTGFVNNCEDTQAVIVNVLDNVVADAGDDVTICSEESVTLTASGGDEYLWNTGETTASIEVTPDSDTEYSVLVYNALSSDESSVMVFVEDCSASQLPPESEEFDFLVFQDTALDVLKVKINGLQSVNAKGLTIYDISGKLLYDESFNQAEMQNQSQMTKEINTTPYARGIYVVRLNYNDTSVIKKIPIR